MQVWAPDFGGGTHGADDAGGRMAGGRRGGVLIHHALVRRRLSLLLALPPMVTGLGPGLDPRASSDESPHRVG